MNVPALAAPDRNWSSMGAVQFSNEATAPLSDEGKAQGWPNAAPHITGQDFAR